MKQEENYIDHLFESARTESPHTSFDEVAETLVSSTSPTLSESVKELLLKNINLNSFLILSIGIAAISSLWFFSFPNEKEISQTTPVTKNQIESSSNQEAEMALPKFIEKKNTTSISSNSSKIISPKKEKKNKPVEILEKNINTFPKEKSTKNIEKTIIPQSPKITSAPSKLIVDQTPQLEKIEINNNAITNNSKKTRHPENPETIENKSFSPWVSEGSGGNNQMEWSIIQSGRVKILNEKELALKAFMETHYLERIFEKDKNGIYSPLTIVSNSSLLEDTNVKFKNKKIRVIETTVAPEFDPNVPFINISRFRVRSKKATLRFKYKDYDVSIQLKKKENHNQWIRSKLKVKNNKKTEVDITF